MDPIHIDFTIPDLSLFIGFGVLVFAIVLYLAISNNWDKLKPLVSYLLSPSKYALPLLFLILVPLALIAVYDIYGLITSPEAWEADKRGLAVLLAAIVGAPFVIWRTWIAQKQSATAEQSHMTDRISKAVEQLGAEKTIWVDGDQQSVPNLEVRLGGIYALSRVARDSPRDHISVMEILCAYVRENFPKETAAQNVERSLGDFPRLFEYSDPEENSRMTSFHLSQLAFRQQKIKNLYGKFGPNSLKAWSESFKPRSDLQAIIRVIGERANKNVEKTYQFGEQIYNFGFRINLANSNLQGVDFEMLDFAGALFSGCSLDGALFRKTILNDAFLNGISACGADFLNPEMDRVVIFDSQMELCNFKDVRIINSKIYRTNLNGSFLTNARFLETELHKVSLEGCQIVESLFIGGNTADEELPLIEQINAFGTSFCQCGMAQLDFGNFANVVTEIVDDLSFILDGSIHNFPEAGLGQQMVITSTSMEDFEGKWQAAKAAANL